LLVFSVNTFKWSTPEKRGKRKKGKGWDEE